VLPNVPLHLLGRLRACHLSSSLDATFAAAVAPALLPQLRLAGGARRSVR
jgi:hypothetical protein